MTSVSLLDGLTPKIMLLSKVNRGLGLQAFNKALSVVQKQMVSDVGNAGYTNWEHEYVNGHKVIKRGRKKLFSRVDKSGHELPHLGKLTKWKLHPVSGVGLVGFIDTKRFTTYFYQGGELVNKGSDRGAVTKSIADKIINGGTVTLSAKQRGMFAHSGFGGTTRVKYKAHRGVLKFGKYIKEAKAKIDSEYEIALKQSKIA